MEAPYLNLKRRLTAILLADVAGYSRLMCADEEATHARFAGHLNELIEPKICEYAGRPVRSMGDGLLVEFDSAIAAVRCAVAIQRGLAEREAAAAEDQRIRLRIGINTGDVIVEDRDIYGNSINIAARLEGLAGPGEIYVTQGVYDQVRGYPSLAFSDQGEHRLKNIAHQIRIFRVESGEERHPISPRRQLEVRWRRLRFQLGRGAWSTAGLGIVLAIAAMFLVAAIPNWRYSAFLPRSSIVILPFRNLSADAAQDYFAAAVTDDLTTDLSRLPGAFVVASATAFTYRHRTVDAREIGRECGVRYLLEGSIEKLGSKVRIDARLIDAETGAAVWADRFDREIKDLWELQAAVTGRIAASLDLQLARAESRRATEERASDPDATDLRYRAMGLYISGITAKHTLAARQLLERAVKLDPDDAEAWAWLADLLISDYLHRWNNIGNDQLEEAETAVAQALAMDHNLALAYYVRGFLYRMKGDHYFALEAFSQAVKMNPNFARAYAQQGNELINVGHPTQAPPLVDKAIRLSPRDPSLGTFYWITGRAYFFAGKYTEAIPWLRRSVELRSMDWYNRLYLVSAYALSDQKEEAKKRLDEFNRIPQFHGYTVARVTTAEGTNPDNDAVIVAGRQKLHDALLRTGMAAQ